MPLTEPVLMKYLADELQIDIADVKPSSLLFSTGVIDSFSLISLITFIEEQCKITVSPDDTTLENLDSVERILAFSNRPR